uniref:Interleukin-4 n=1 Tax=Amphiprion ocellaris TaxID=80972 RepID=A0AAQ5WZ66_AMPOC
MEHYFRIALCMFLFVGYLQAMPTCSKSISDVKQHDLRVNPQKVKCVSKNWKCSLLKAVDECEIAALTIFKDELIRALNSEQCEDKEESIGATLDALPVICPQPVSINSDVLHCLINNLHLSTFKMFYPVLKPAYSPHSQTSSPDCKWEGDGSRKQFAAFWEDFTTLLKKSNSAPAKGTQ